MHLITQVVQEHRGRFAAELGIDTNFLSNLEFWIAGNSKGENLVAAGFSLRPHRRDACATKKIPRPQALHLNTLPLMSN
jgi:hypothetical protein